MFFYLKVNLKMYCIKIKKYVIMWNMKNIENKKIIYYKEYTDDVIKSKDQEYKIKDNYKWIHDNIFYRICSWIIWKIAEMVVFIYYKLILKVKIENSKVLKRYKNQGYFIYGNHTRSCSEMFLFHGLL